MQKPDYSLDAAALVEASPACDSFDDAAKAALAAVLAAPMYCCPVTSVGDKAGRKEILKALGGVGISRKAIAHWLGGLVAAGHPPDVLASLESLGWLVTWEELPRWPPAVTLTPLAVARLGGLVLREIYDDCGVSRWALPDPRPRRGIKARQMHGTNQDLLDVLVEETDPGPVQNAIDAERWLTKPSVSEDGEPIRDESTGLPKVKPTLLLPTQLLPDGLRGGLGTPRDGKIPIKRVKGKPHHKTTRKKKTRKAKVKKGKRSAA
jgi:hypothetical protein